MILSNPVKVYMTQCPTADTLTPWYHELQVVRKQEVAVRNQEVVSEEEDTEDNDSDSNEDIELEVVESGVGEFLPLKRNYEVNLCNFSTVGTGSIA